MAMPATPKPRGRLSIKSQQLPWFKGSGRGHFRLRLSKSNPIVPVVLHVALGPVDRVLGAPALGAVAGVWLSAGDRARHRVGDGQPRWRCGQPSVDLRPPLRAPGEVFVNPGTPCALSQARSCWGQVERGEARTSGHSVCVWFHQHRELHHDARGIDRVEGAFLDAQGTATCHSIFLLGRSLGRFVGLDVRGMWGGLALCGAAQTNTLNLDLSFANAPSFAGGVGSGEDLLEGVVDVTGQQRHVYGGNTDPHGASGILRHLSIRHGSTNLGWNMSGNGQETDLLQLGACGSGTVVEHIELLASADDGLHIFGGLVEVRRVMSAFHAEDAFEATKAGKVWGALVWPSRHRLGPCQQPAGPELGLRCRGGRLRGEQHGPFGRAVLHAGHEQPHFGDQRGGLRGVLPQPSGRRLDQQHCARGERRRD